MVICPYCQETYNSISKLQEHVKNEHIEKYQEFCLKTKYLDKGKNIQICPICGNPVKMVNIWTSRKTCGNRQCKLELNKQIANLPENVEKARIRRINYLENHFNSSAWGNRANLKHSFLENWFINNIIKEYDLDKKYNIISEYCVLGYFLDFAFIDLKIDVELDGKCHFINGKRVLHDIKRDKVLKNNGWKIFRISYLDIKNEKKIKSDFFNFLQSFNISEIDTTIYYNKILSYIEFKHQQKIEEDNQKIQQKIEELSKKEELIFNTIRDHKINIKQFGFLSKLEDLTNIPKKSILKILNIHNIQYYKNSSNPSSNQCWIYNPNLKKSLRIFNEDLNEYLNAGWRKGRKMKID